MNALLQNILVKCRWKSENYLDGCDPIEVLGVGNVKTANYLHGMILQTLPKIHCQAMLINNSSGTSYLDKQPRKGKKENPLKQKLTK